MGKWSKYKKKYRKDWESNPKLVDWLAPVPGTPDRAFCRYCKKALRAHLRDLVLHTDTIRHRRNAATAIPSSDVLTTTKAEGASEEQLVYLDESNYHLILESLIGGARQNSGEHSVRSEKSPAKGAKSESTPAVEKSSMDDPDGRTALCSSGTRDGETPAGLNTDEVILKVRKAGSQDEDFLEVYLDNNELTIQSLKGLCCRELGVEAASVRKIRKLPDIVIRSDKNVQHLKNYDELEIVTS